jgi:hypothetical protein
LREERKEEVGGGGNEEYWIRKAEVEGIENVGGGWE